MTTPQRPLPSPAQLAAAYRDIARIHAEHLVQHGVKLPAENSYKWIWLAMLHHYAPDKVHKDEFRTPCAGKIPTPAGISRCGISNGTAGISPAAAAFISWLTRIVPTRVL